MTSETPDVLTNTNDTETQSTSGRVKWFNNKAGYGFITVSSGSHADQDVFVHHSAIEVGQEQYRYLVQGEYVNFTLCSVKDQTHKWQAGSVKGMNSGKLMCETRHESRVIRSTTDNTDEHTSTHATGRQFASSEQKHYRIKSRGPGPRDGDEWMLVRKTRPIYNQSQSQSLSPGRSGHTGHGVRGGRGGYGAHKGPREDQSEVLHTRTSKST